MNVMDESIKKTKKKREREREREKERDGCVRTVTSRRRLISICSTRVCRIKERERERERGQRATGVIEWPTFSARRGVKRAANLIIDQLTSPECPEASNHQLPPARPHAHTHTHTHTHTHFDCGRMEAPSTHTHTHTHSHTHTHTPRLRPYGSAFYRVLPSLTEFLPSFTY